VTPAERTAATSKAIIAMEPDRMAYCTLPEKSQIIGDTSVQIYGVNLYTVPQPKPLQSVITPPAWAVPYILPALSRISPDVG
jgi:hypothetical protein